MSKIQWREVEVGMDCFGWESGETFKAQIIDGEYWNGWICPRFSRPEAERLVEAQAEMLKLFPLDFDQLLWSGDAIHKIPHLGSYGEGEAPSEGDIEIIVADADGCYTIGACEWCWEEV